MNATIQVAHFWKIFVASPGHTERCFKVAVIGTTNCNLQSVLADRPDINLDDHQEASHIIDRTIASNVELEVLRLMRQQPEFHYFEERIIGKLFERGQDMHWRRLILNQLRFSESPLTKLATERQLDVLPPTAPQEILVRIPANIPLERQEWARKVLIWTLYSFHPLSVWEVGTALVLQDESLSPEAGDTDLLVSHDITGELEKFFKGIFVVKHDENKAHYSHPTAREFLQNADCAQHLA